MSCLLTALLIGASPLVRAADDTNAPAPTAQPPRPPSPNGNATMQPRMRALPPSGAQGGLMGVLTEEQRNSYMEASKANHDKLMELQTQLLAARKRLFEAALTNKFDEAAIRGIAMDEARVQAEMNVLSVKAVTEIEPPLTADQIEQLKNPRPPQPMIRPMPQQQPAPAPVPPRASDTNSLPPKQ